MPNLPKPTTKAPWLGLPIDVSDRNGNPIHIGDVLHFDPAEWGSDDEYFCVEFRQGEVRHPGSIGDLSAWCTIVRKWDADAPDTSPRRPDGRFATLELPAPLPHGPEVWPVLLDRLQRSERLRDLPVFGALQAEMEARRDLGIARYGQTLHRDDGRPIGVDAFQECQDMLAYMERDLMRLEAVGAYRYLPALEVIIDAQFVVLANLYALCEYPPRLDGGA